MRIPTATYRVQLNSSFDFNDLAGVLEYLAQLGISDIYASPIFKARSGSTHGYDILDPNQLNPELGTDDDWKKLTVKRRSLNMGWLQDIVPNHMAYIGDNTRIQKILEKGPASEAAEFFDIIWDHPQPALNGHLSAPFLGAPLEQCLEKGEISLQYKASGLCIAYYEHRFPLALKSYPHVFGETTDQPARDFGWQKAAQWLQLVGLLAGGDEDRVPDTETLKRQLWARFQEFSEIRQWVDQRLNTFNAPEQRDKLVQLLEHQFFHLNFWQNAANAINYRRFFSINDLIAVRQEDHHIFEQTHAMITRMVKTGVFTGLRVDHIDGLLTPGRYLQKLREVCGDCYLVVEKITANTEELPDTWPVQGTTGYEFAAHLDRLFTYADNQTQTDSAYTDFCGVAPDFNAVVQDSKAEVMRTHFLGDLENLSAKFKVIPVFMEDSSENLTMALAQVIIHMPVYRTYRSDGGRDLQDDDILRTAIATAMNQRPDLKPILFRIDGFLRAPADDSTSRRRAVGAFEQLCATMAAKGVEDTALYRFHRLPALNEVGGDPQHFGESRDAFHQFIQQRRQRFPHSLNALSSHDSKRSGDVRARLLVLSEMPVYWTARVKAWREINRRPSRNGKMVRQIDAAMAHLLYQTLVATCPSDNSFWPGYINRIVAYAVKAAREAKQFTNWAAPDQAYETELAGYIEHILDSGESDPFLSDLRAFAARVAYFGAINILAQTLIQLTAPGVPDIYQGAEFNDDRLVDPDNRSPVDYQARRRKMEEIHRTLQSQPDRAAAAMLLSADLDKIKLYLIHTALRARLQAKNVFTYGDYLPMTFSGRMQRHGAAFARVHAGRWYITAVPRFFCTLASEEGAAERIDPWQGTCLVLPDRAPRKWRNLLTRARIELQGSMFSLYDLFREFPVALLKAEV